MDEHIVRVDSDAALECFGFHDTMTRFLEKLFKSYAFDAIDGKKEETDDGVSPDKPRRFLASAGRSKAGGTTTTRVGLTPPRGIKRP